MIAAIVLYRTADHLITSRHEFTIQVIDGINDLLFVVILMELLRTVVAHLETDDFQVKSFLIVGIISALRHILSIGPRLTLTSAAVVLALALGLVLISP